MVYETLKENIDNNLLTVAFYNLENLFDTHDDKFTNDNDFLPSSVKRWTPKRYENKLRKLGFTISNIGKEQTGMHPVIIGLAEVENNFVLDDLLNSKHLNELPYDYVHYDSSDERGIDVALLFDVNRFELIESDIYSITLYEDDGDLDYTRDILVVHGLLEGYDIHFIVNHWPSRREGEEETEYKRITASEKAGEIINAITKKDPKAKIIVLGDFNDEPSDKSVKQLVNNHDLYNPMSTINTHRRGSLSHDFKWNIFDQIIFSTNFFERDQNSLSFAEVDVFDEDFLKQFKGKYRGTPFRTYVGKKYKGGYSDHFPVYILLEK